MNAPDTADDGLPARSIFHTMASPRRRRRSPMEKLRAIVRDYAGTGIFVVMLTVCGALLVLSR